MHGHGNLFNQTKNNKVLKLKSKNFCAGLDSNVLFYHKCILYNNFN